VGLPGEPGEILGGGRPAPAGAVARVVEHERLPEDRAV
jgi:hypothetical protein